LKHLLLALVLMAPTTLAGQSPAARASAGEQMDDQGIAAFARKLLENPRATNANLLDGLKTIQNYSFKDKNAPEKEYVLFAQGILEDRTDQLTRAVVTFRRFERAYPNSQYMPEANYVFARHAMNQKSYKNAESFLKKIIESNQPTDSKFNAQGLLIWLLLEENRREEAIPLVQPLFPIGKSKPDERALVAIIEMQHELNDLEGAKKIRSSYITNIKEGPLRYRLNFAWGMLLNQAGQIVESARALREVIRDAPNSEQADEVRMLLATLIADGKLPERANTAHDTTDSLIAQLRTAGLKGDVRERAELLQLRMAFEGKKWRTVIDMADRFAKNFPDSASAATVKSNRDDAMRTIIQETMDSNGPFYAIPLLTAENIALLTPETRARLVPYFVSKGMPEAATKVIDASPESERPQLQKSLTKNIPFVPPPPPKLLAGLSQYLTDQRGELGQIRLLLDGKKWGDASLRIEKLYPGPSKIQAILALLTRPMPTSEIPLRMTEAEGWLAKCSEDASVIEPLVIFIADLHMQIGDTKAALDRYPKQPQQENLGWVSLMRATALARLGQKDEAKQILGQTDSVPEFRPYRQALATQLNR